MDSPDAPLFPVFLDLRGRVAAVVGGGPVATRKVLSLVEAGARVRVVAGEITEALRALSRDDRIELRLRPYGPGDLAGATLAFIAVDDPAVSTQVAADARGAGIPVNVADQPELGDVQLPATVRRGRLQIAVSTGGASPAWAKRLRDEVAGCLGPEYERLFDALAEARQAILVEGADPGERRRALLALADEDLLALARCREGADLVQAIVDAARLGVRGREVAST